MVSPNKLPIVKSAARHACLQRFSRSGLPNKLSTVKSAARHACLQRFSRSGLPNKLPIVKSAARHACLQGFSRSGVPSKLPIAKKYGGGEVRFVRMRQRAVEIFQHAFCVGVFRVLLQLRGKAGAHAAGIRP